MTLRDHSDVTDRDADYLSQRQEIGLPVRGGVLNEGNAHVQQVQPVKTNCLRRFAALLIALVRLPSEHPGDHIISRQSNADRLRAITKGVRDAGH